MIIRIINTSDFDFITKIAAVEDIRYTPQDLTRIISYEPEGCFIALDGERRLGIVTTIAFGKVGWIGNVFVAESARRRGAGTKLVREAIRHMQSRGVEFPKLYCFPSRITFYRRLGFTTELQVQVTSGKGRKSSYTNVRQAAKDSMKELTAFDEKFFGADRSHMLRRFQEEFEEYCFAAYADDRLVGYIMASGSENEYEVGPWVVEPQCQERLAEELLKAELNMLDRKNFELASPMHNLTAERILEKCDLHRKGVAVRMGYGGKAPIGMIEGILGIGGLDRG